MVMGVFIALFFTGAWTLYGVFGFTPAVANTIGLCMEIIGIVILFKFGWPQPRPGSFFRLRGTDENDGNEALRWQHSRWAVGGLALIVVGFACQIGAGWLPPAPPEPAEPPCEEVLMC